MMSTGSPGEVPRKKTEKPLEGVLRAALIIIVVLWFANLVITLLVGKPDFARSGSLGDSFGGLNALFSGAAFALLVYTALLQRKELELQRQELQDTRAEFERQTQNQREHLKLLQEEREAREKLRIAEAQPRLMIRKPTGDVDPLHTIRVNALIFNGGAPIYDMKIAVIESPLHNPKVVMDPDTVLGKHDSAQLRILAFEMNGPEGRQVSLSGLYRVGIVFTDSLGRSGAIELIFSIEWQAGEVDDVLEP